MRKCSDNRIDFSSGGFHLNSVTLALNSLIRLVLFLHILLILSPGLQNFSQFRFLVGIVSALEKDFF